MDSTPFDTLAKAGLRVLLAPRGKLEVPIAITVAPKEGDGFFAPDAEYARSSSALGLLGELLTVPTLIEVFSTPLREDRLEECLLKLHGLRDQQAHQAEAAQMPYLRTDWPWLLVFVPTATDEMLERLVTRPQVSSPVGGRETVADFGPGVYTLSKSDRLRLVEVDRVPPTPHTHLVRLLFGRGAVLEHAWVKLEALSLPHEEKRRLLYILENFRRHLIKIGELSPEEAFMQFMPGTDIPDYWQEDVDREVEGRTAVLRAQLATVEAERQKSEQERQKSEQERQKSEQERQKSEAERIRALQEQARALAIALATRFPGINGEQELLTRYLSTMPFSEALSLVLTRSLSELLEAAGRAS